MNLAVIRGPTSQFSLLKFLPRKRWESFKIKLTPKRKKTELVSVLKHY